MEKNNHPIKVNTQNSKISKTLPKDLDKLSTKHNLRALTQTLLNHFDKDSRIHAAYALGKISSPEVREILEKVLSIEHDRQVLLEILSVLNWLSEDEPSEALINFFLKNQEPELIAKTALIFKRSNSPKILRALKTKLSQTNSPQLKIIVLNILSNFSDDETLEILKKSLLFDTHTKVRKISTKILGKISHAQASTILFEALEKIMEIELRREIIWALSKRQDWLVADLLPHFQNEMNLENQKMILWLLSRRGKIEDLVALVKTLDYPIHESLQRDLIFSFGKFKNKLSGDQLLEIFGKTHSPKIRQHALWALSRVLEKKHLSRLIKLKEHEEDPYIREELSAILRMY